MQAVEFNRLLFYTKIPGQAGDLCIICQSMTLGVGLVYEDVPVEDVFEFAALDAFDEVVELEGFWSALAVAVGVDCLLF